MPQFVLYYCLPNRRLAVVRDFRGIVLSFANEDLAASQAQVITAQETYRLDYPIVVEEGFRLDNTTDGKCMAASDAYWNETYGYPRDKTPKGLYTIASRGEPA